MSGRSHLQCRHRWTNVLSLSLSRSLWNEEDLKLARLHGLIGKQWSVVAEEIPSRSDSHCRNRSLIVVGKEPWSSAEDTLAQSLYSVHGPDWDAIADNTPERTNLQCRYRIFLLLGLPTHAYARPERISQPSSSTTKRARTAENANSCAGCNVVAGSTTSTANKNDGLVPDENSREKAGSHWTSSASPAGISSNVELRERGGSVSDEHRDEDICSRSTLADKRTVDSSLLNHAQLAGRDKPSPNDVAEDAPSVPSTDITANEDESKDDASNRTAASKPPAEVTSRQFRRDWLKSLGKSDWSTADDKSLLSLYEEYGKNWPRKAEQMVGRSAQDCHGR